MLQGGELTSELGAQVARVRILLFLYPAVALKASYPAEHGKKGFPVQKYSHSNFSFFT